MTRPFRKLRGPHRSDYSHFSSPPPPPQLSSCQVTSSLDPACIETLTRVRIRLQFSFFGGLTVNIFASTPPSLSKSGGRMAAGCWRSGVHKTGIRAKGGGYFSRSKSCRMQSGHVERLTDYKRSIFIGPAAAGPTPPSDTPSALRDVEVHFCPRHHKKMEKNTTRFFHGK